MDAVARRVPRVHTAIQTRHALQSIIHHKEADLARLFDEGLLDAAERQKMSHLLSQTQHNLYYTASAHRSSDDYADTVKAVFFRNKLHNADNHQALLSDMNSTAHITEHASHRAGQVHLYYSVGLVPDAHQAQRHGPARRKCDYAVERRRVQQQQEDEDFSERIETEYKAQTNVVMYFMHERCMKRAFEREPEVREFLWRQCAVKVMVSMYRRNNTALFAFYRQFDINIMCQKSTFVEVEKGRVFALPSFMTLLLFGYCARVKGGHVFHHKQILVAGFAYSFSADAKLLILDYDPKPAGTFNRMRRQEPQNSKFTRSA